PNFATFVCPALIAGGTTGYFSASTVASLRHASVASYMKKITIPTLLLQGQGDTLFNLNEAAATYEALQKQGTEVKMVWHSWGHSVSSPQPGEFDSGNPDPAHQWETRRVVNWFYHYLKGHTSTSTGAPFSWFRDWVTYSGDAAPAFGHSNHFPVGKERSLYLSGSALTTDADAIQSGSQQYVTPPAGAPTRIDKLDALGGYLNLPLPEQDAPGTSVSWTSPALTDAWDVVGSPKLTLKVTAPLAVGGTPATDLVTFARIEDVAPDGTATQIHDLTAPIRVPHAKQAFTVTMPAFVHQFAAGHKIRLVLSGSSLNYRGGLVPSPVTVTTGSNTQVLQLPVTN
ncbi:MAG TPA: CocE/NonD family hydrolase C-terminal non-catalytic domain-containing protein, partial [Marmoricola sp.]